jgi:hypothetical protein
LNEKWLGIKEETVHRVITTFKNIIKLNKLGKYLYKFKFNWENKWKNDANLEVMRDGEI